MGNAFYALNALPKKFHFLIILKKLVYQTYHKLNAGPKDGGVFITLPQVYSEDINNPGISNSNIGMYRIQISGNKYIKDKEVGVHYQIHRGIGNSSKERFKKNQPLKKSQFLLEVHLHILFLL